MEDEAEVRRWQWDLLELNKQIEEEQLMDEQSTKLEVEAQDAAREQEKLRLRMQRERLELETAVKQERLKLEMEEQRLDYEAKAQAALKECGRLTRNGVGKRLRGDMRRLDHGSR